LETAILIGIQGSGKSTFAHQHLGNTHIRLSLDTLKNRQRERALHYACFAANQRFVIDNTNPDPTGRAPFIAAARAAGFRVVAYFFPPDLKSCLTRNSTRPNKTRVPDAALHATASKLTPPNPSEGFDAIFHVQLHNDQFTIQEIWPCTTTSATA
jgi:predicted kinase